MLKRIRSLKVSLRSALYPDKESVTFDFIAELMIRLKILFPNLFNVGEEGAVESAFIPELKRSTLCVSSQIGCKMRCLFCMTGHKTSMSPLFTLSDTAHF